MDKFAKAVDKLILSVYIVCIGGGTNLVKAKVFSKKLSAYIRPLAVSVKMVSILING